MHQLADLYYHLSTKMLCWRTVSEQNMLQYLSDDFFCSFFMLQHRWAYVHDSMTWMVDSFFMLQHRWAYVHDSMTWMVDCCILHAHTLTHCTSCYFPLCKCEKFGFTDINSSSCAGSWSNWRVVGGRWKQSCCWTGTV